MSMQCKFGIGRVTKKDQQTVTRIGNAPPWVAYSDSGTEYFSVTVLPATASSRPTKKDDLPKRRTTLVFRATQLLRYNQT